MFRIKAAPGVFERRSVFVFVGGEVKVEAEAGRLVGSAQKGLLAPGRGAGLSRSTDLFLSSGIQTSLGQECFPRFSTNSLGCIIILSSCEAIYGLYLSH